MLKSLLFGLFGLAAAAAAAPQRRATGSTIYVYGTGIKGLPMQATSNGTVFVTDDTSPGLYNVSLNVADSSTPWTSTLANKSATLSGYSFYIIPAENSFAAIGFVRPDATAPTGAVTTGFALLGTNIQYADGDTYISQFWARPSNSTAWEILWNSSGDSHSDSIPVTLKLTAPTVVERD
ncbi:hypothetical protein CMQ_1472 [Grosmannia clavigera kw1407]|uniref:Cytochrome p450 protein n=1 Tax=Grosmannia clavigera (strain kw1407 / UAMH 11150) TaxID=655863 RepID=F0XDM5_GROCL|nr:uncharacterized protein CMQ_1472 [Grosmannia clavigera kw1407]EFX04544.1 hypothetical protein CMQ_1472 [Grosmannia clavigera kw1407]